MDIAVDDDLDSLKGWKFSLAPNCLTKDILPEETNSIFTNDEEN